MRPSMTLHVERSREALSADVAFVRPLSGVSPHVHGIVERSGETLATQYTQMGRFLNLIRTPRVDFDVRPEVVLSVELLMAVGTLELFLRRIVHPVMAQQMFVPGEPSMAHFTKELVVLLIVLLPGVSAEAVLPHEPLAAEVAEELFVLIFAL